MENDNEGPKECLDEERCPSAGPWKESRWWTLTMEGFGGGGTEADYLQELALGQVRGADDGL